MAAITLPFFTVNPANAAIYLKADIGEAVDTKAEVSGYSIPVEPGMTYALGLGYDLKGPLRLEGEYRKINADVLGLVDVDATALFANALIDLNTSGKIQPFFGAGIGHANVEAGVAGYNLEADSFAWQAIAGAGLKLSDNLTADVSYRLIDLGDLDFGLGGYKVDATTGAVTFGLRMAV